MLSCQARPNQMAKLLPALAVLFLATTKVVAITSGESNQRAPHHIIVRGDSSEPSSLLRTEQDAVLAHQADAAGKMQLDVSSSGHFIAPHHVKRRDGESGENSDQRSREILAAEGKASAATALEMQQLPETLSSEIRVAVSVVAFLLAVVTVAFAIYTYFAKPLSREELQRRDEAATKVQKRVRGNAARNMLENQQKASSQEAAGGSLRDVLLEGDEINGRYRKLRPNASIEPENDERNYQTMVHTLTYEELAQVLNSKLNCSDNYRCMTEPAGLTEEQAGLYLNAHGRNKITPPAREDPWIKLVKLTFGGLFNALLWFCVGAQVILIRIKVKEHPTDTMAVDEFVTPIILTVVIVAAAFLQWYTEMQAENMMESVQGMQATQDIRVVRRDSHGNRLDLDLNPELLVPGDVIFLEAGVRIPADLRILHCTDGMEVDNSALTGESMPEARVACVEVGEAVMEARNVAFAATTVLKGNATCIVHSTGDLTFLGKIASGLKGPRTHSTLEIQIEHFVHIVALVAIGVGLLSIGANMLSPVQRSLSAILENSATALFAQVPEGLLPTVTISLMIASRQLSDRKVLVRKLDAVETLGCVNVICSDKTGTLTTGEMSAVTMVVPESGQEAGASRRVPDDLNPLERLTPRGGSAENLDISNRVAGVFDIATTQDWNFQCLCMCGLLNNAAQVSGGEPMGEVSLSLPGSREWTERWKATGSPTEVAILRAALENLGGLAGAMQFRAEFGLVHEVPFNSDNKWMLTIHTHPKAVSSSRQYQMILKGAPERVLDKCTLTTDERAEIEEYQSELMSKGLRVLCFATRALSGDETGGRAPGMQQNFVDADPGGTGSAGDCNYPMDGFCFVGLVGIEDPPKRGVANAVIAAQAAGVKVVMVTGDHPETAKAIASRINIVPPAGLFGDAATFCAVPGSMLEDKMPVGANFSDEDPPQVTDFWQRAVTHTRVFARVSPIHKQVIVQAFQHFGNNRIGDICAMTGDGVNDAPALKQADVGVAMGVRGTEVAKDAADIILMDDNFSSIVDGIEQGRLASDNLQKSIMYTLCSKVPQVAPTFAEILGVPMALNAVQVLLIDIGTDIWTAIAFAMQPAEAALMQYAPRHPHFEKLVNWKVLVYSYCYIGQLQMLLCWIFYLMEPGIMNLVRKQETSFSHGERLVHHRGMTVYYWTLVLGQIAAAVSTTTKTQRIFGPGGYGLPNMSLNLLILLEVILGVAVMYEPNMNKIFNTAPLSMSQVLLPVLAIPIILSIDEVRKLIVRASMPLPLLPQQLSAEEVSSAHRRRSLPLPAPTATAAPGAGTRTEGFASSRYRASVA